jgi:hypothetical protein
VDSPSVVQQLPRGGAFRMSDIEANDANYLVETLKRFRCNQPLGLIVAVAVVGSQDFLSLPWACGCVSAFS